ncbi:MAG: ABC transporter ATP-binding protein/permease, partial [Myxococcales bacterium]|nr:ABC transporter ATP-binding protein/permease [Myxococcales bacterium]
RRLPLVVGSLIFMAVSAAATAGYAWLAGPLLGSLEGDRLSVASQTAIEQTKIPPSLSWTEIVIALVFLGLFRALSEMARAHFSSRLQLSIVREIRGKVLEHVLRLEPRALLRWPPGELASRVHVEVHGIRTLLHLGFAQGIRSILVATALAIVALRVDTALAIPGLVVLPLAVAAIAVGARPARKLQRELLGAESTVVADSSEAIDGAAVLRAYGAMTARAAQIDRAAAESERRGVRAETWGTVASPLVELAAALGIAAAFALAWATRSNLDLASAGTVFVALILMYRPLHGLAQSIFGWSSGLASLDRLDELLRLPTQDTAGGVVHQTGVQTLELQRLSFGYGDRPVLNAAEVRFKAGELVAITGPSGAGKSTLLAVVAGILDPTEGTITVDGAPVTTDSRTTMTAWMPQAPTLFHDTIVANITLGDTHPHRGRALEAAKRAGLDSFVMARPNGYDGILLEGGGDLSAGERQRVTFARALYREAPILLLDEPTSALDGEQEANVLRVCREQADLGCIVIVATHRDDFLRHADRVLKLQNAMVIEWDEQASNRTLH